MLTDAHITAVVPTTNLDRAREFYTTTLGLRDTGTSTPGREMVFSGGGDTMLELYERETAGEADHTLVTWQVPDVPATVEQLRGRGVAFEEYDMPGIKTENGIVTQDGFQAAWFRDPDGNILCVHSEAQSS
jgi:catechol 2,3-dioxygenase-like lactoylglutathione lyase family enzyme